MIRKTKNPPKLFLGQRGFHERLRAQGFGNIHFHLASTRRGVWRSFVIDSFPPEDDALGPIPFALLRPPVAPHALGPLTMSLSKSSDL